MCVYWGTGTKIQTTIGPMYPNPNPCILLKHSKLFIKGEDEEKEKFYPSDFSCIFNLTTDINSASDEMKQSCYSNLSLKPILFSVSQPRKPRLREELLSVMGLVRGGVRTSSCFLWSDS